jgi:hypothetical protein
MNDLIKRLAEEANIHRRVNNSGDGWDFTCLEKDLEKFAELIVKECVAVCEDMDDVDNFEQYMHPRTPRYDCAIEIKEHFGVK